MEQKANLEILEKAKRPQLLCLVFGVCIAAPWLCQLLLFRGAVVKSAKTANKPNLQRNPAPWVCKHTNRCAAARGRWAPGGFHSLAFWDMRLGWGRLWVWGLWMHRCQRSLFGPFSVLLFLTNSWQIPEVFGPLGRHLRNMNPFVFTIALPYLISLRIYLTSNLIGPF